MGEVKEPSYVSSREISGSPDIVLTTDPELLEKLKRKFEEYKTRLEYQAPEVDWRETYKKEILKALLEKGTVSAEQLSREFSERYGEVFTPFFNDAYGVIKSYNSHELERLRGGTGLK